MTESGAGDRLLRLRARDDLDNHGGIVPTPMRRAGTGLCLSGGTTGDVVTNAVDDRIVDSLFRGNDEIRGGLWVFAGEYRDPLPDLAGDRLL